MFRSLFWKLSLAFALVAFLTAALVALFIRLTSADRLAQLIIEQQRSSLEQTLQNYYSEHGSWGGVSQQWAELQFQNTLPPGQNIGQNPPPQGQPPPGSPGRENLLGLAGAQGTVIVPVDPRYPAGSQLPVSILKTGVPIVVNGQQVGTILTAQQPPGFNPQEARYLQRTTQALIYAGLGALLVALILSFLLARTLTGPLQDLTQAAKNITRGQVDQQVRVSSSDEIGQLALAFNRMSQEVASVNQMRRQMTADIAHDLRTPLTVISGYLESMRDGVLKPTPERLALIYSEIERLQNLVGDLRMLSLADAGELSLNLQAIDPKGLLEGAASLFAYQAKQNQVAILVEAVDNLPPIHIDENRMMQVLENLISNALRYTPSGGTITLAAYKFDGSVALCVQDTGEGIPSEELPYVFNRFHRVDKSRHTESGESGLGLAIVKALVEAQGGSAAVESTSPKGTTIRLVLPEAL